MATVVQNVQDQIQKIGPHHYRVPSRSRPGVFHEVLLEPTPMCTCEAFYFRGDCRHIAAARGAEAVERARASGLTFERAFDDLFGE